MEHSAVMYITYHISSLGHVHNNKTTQNHFTYNSIAGSFKWAQWVKFYDRQSISMWDIMVAILKDGEQRSCRCVSKSKCFFMVKTINKLIQRSIRLKHGI